MHDTRRRSNLRFSNMCAGKIKVNARHFAACTEEQLISE